MTNVVTETVATDTVVADSRAGSLMRSLRRRTEWLVTKPRAVVATLAVAGLVVRHAWLTTLPLSAGDWHWPSRGRILQWFPWPPVWDSTLGLSGENRFLDIFRFPVFAVNGLIAALGGSWTLIEKVVYFVPLAVLLPVAGWLLAREILGPTRWAVLSALVMVANTYFLFEANGEVPIVLAEAIGCLALLAFIKAMRGKSLRWGLAAGLLVGVVSAYDIRPAFLTVVLMAAYLLILAITEPGWPLLRRRLFLSVVAGAVFFGTQAFWIIPFVTYHGHRALPTPEAPDFNIITLTHGIAGVAAGWTGGTPASLVQAPLNPLFMVIPIVAMLPLLWRRMNPELLWLALSAVVFAFLAKTNTPPFGGLYNWIYLHVPGFRLFREGSKFFYPIAIAYAILIPAALRAMVERARGLEGMARRYLRATTALCLALVLLVTGTTLLVLERGQLGSTTTPVAEPRAFSQITAMLDADHRSGSVLWFGSPIFMTSDQKEHRYVIASATHALTNLTGNALSTLINRRDVFQYFCPSITEAFCYVNQTVFPYLVNTVGASYIISPASLDAGKLPDGLTRSWLHQQLEAMFGPPIEVGDAPTQFFVWHLHNAQPAIATYPAVALVDSGPWSLSSVLPALQAMGIPAAYRQSFNKADFPPAPPSLPDSVGVVPRIDGGCLGTSSRSVGVMAETSAETIAVTVGSTASDLGLLSRSSRLPGWGVYGPVTISSGLVPIATSSVGVTLGPCVQWSALTATAFGGHAQVAGPTHSGDSGEQIRAPLTGTPEAWTELRRFYDAGWHMDGRKPTTVADGLFNLFHPTKPVTARRGFVFSFSTIKWERLGQVITFLAVIAALLLIWRSARRENDTVTPARTETVLESRLAPNVGLLGVFFLGLTTIAVILEWFGVPSRVPWMAVTSDPYSLDAVFGTMALVLLGLSLITRLGEHLARYRNPVRVPGRRLHQRVVLAAVICLFTAACTGSVENADQALTNAQRAGIAPSSLEGSSIDQAQLQQESKDARGCVADYTIALKTFPTLITALAGRASCYRNGVNAAAAVQDLDRALALSPGDPQLLIQRAAADRGIGDTNAAVNDYRGVASAPPSTDGQFLAAIDGLIAIGNTKAAGQVLQIALRRYPSSPLTRVGVADVANADNDDGQTTAALSQAERLAVTNSEKVLVLSLLCHYQVVHHEYQPALATCQQTVALNPAAAGAFDDLGAAQAALGQLDQAIRDLTSAIGAVQGNANPYAQPAGVDGFGLANLYEARGRLYVERHETQPAIADYRRALKALPSGSPDYAARLRADIASAEHD